MRVTHVQQHGMPTRWHQTWPMVREVNSRCTTVNHHYYFMHRQSNSTHQCEPNSCAYADMTYAFGVISDRRHDTHLSTTFFAKNAPKPRAVCDTHVTECIICVDILCAHRIMNAWVRMLTLLVGDGADCLLTRIWSPWNNTSYASIK